MGARPELPALGGPQFLYSPALLEVLPEPDALMVLAQSIRDPSPAVRVLSLQGLGNILFHPEKVRAGRPVQARPRGWNPSSAPFPRVVRDSASSSVEWAGGGPLGRVVGA